LSCPIDLHHKDNKEKLEYESEAENDVNEHVAVCCPSRGENAEKQNYIDCCFRDEENKKNIMRIKNLYKYDRDLVYKYYLDDGHPNDE
jgi:hypothetical protein